MKFKWSPFDCDDVYYLNQAEEVSDTINAEKDTVLVFSPFDEMNSKSYRFSGEIKKETNFTLKNNHRNNVIVNGVNDFSNYRDCLNNAIVGCQSDEFTKIVVSRKLLLNGELNAELVFRELVSCYFNCFVYFFEIHGVIYIGATPEKLLTSKLGICSSASLAGTMSVTNGLSLANWGKKEIEEQNIVTKYIQLSFSEFCSDSAVSELSIKQNGRICHLHSEITGSLHDNQSLYSLLKSLHPTPAVCGLPKQKAKEWIISNEGYNREYYAGYIGIIDNYGADFYVNLRCLKYSNKQITLYAGGGITKDSIAEKEFEETKQKFDVLLSVIKKCHTFVEQ